MEDTINIKELKEGLNLFFYNNYNWGIDRLTIVNNACDDLGGAVNEVFKVINRL